jgi:hypothetical protein
MKMSRIAPVVAGLLLGLVFALASVPVLLNLAPMPPLPEGSPAAMFLGAFGPTGYLTFIKVLELVGAVLVAIPRTRNLGLMVLVPILVNIVAFHVFIMRGEGMLNPLLVAPVLLAIYLIWVERKPILGLVNRAQITQTDGRL